MMTASPSKHYRRHHKTDCRGTDYLVKDLEKEMWTMDFNKYSWSKMEAQDRVG